MPIGFYSPGMSQVLPYGVIIFYNRNTLDEILKNADKSVKSSVLEVK